MNEPIRNDEQIEALANYAHEAWSGWMKYLFSKCRPGTDYLGMSGYMANGSLVIPKESVERWRRQMNTPYAELPEREKESDRDEARKMLAVLANRAGDGPAANS